MPDKSIKQLTIALLLLYKSTIYIIISIYSGSETFSQEMLAVPQIP